jgi:hypothetical protein
MSIPGQLFFKGVSFNKTLKVALAFTRRAACVSWGKGTVLASIGKYILVPDRLDELRQENIFLYRTK